MRFLIGEVAALTGISPGRIRHYGRQGLLRVDQLDSGYRSFSDTDILTLLRIDLLRSLGLGLDDIAAMLTPGSGRESLEAHREVLVAERDRLDRVIAAVDAALAGEGIEQLAVTHRSSVGSIGRPAIPLSPRAAEVFAGVLDGTQLVVPALFGQLLLPAGLIRLLDKVACCEGVEELARRLSALVPEVLSGRADAAAWVNEQLASPLPDDVAATLRLGIPTVASLPLLVKGIPTWAASISPAAETFVLDVRRLAAARGALVLGVIVVPGEPVSPAGRRAARGVRARG